MSAIAFETNLHAVTHGRLRRRHRLLHAHQPLRVRLTHDGNLWRVIHTHTHMRVWNLVYVGDWHGVRGDTYQALGCLHTPSRMGRRWKGSYRTSVCNRRTALVVSSTMGPSRLEPAPFAPGMGDAAACSGTRHTTPRALRRVTAANMSSRQAMAGAGPQRTSAGAERRGELR
jgi:hypothetical protein